MSQLPDYDFRKEYPNGHPGAWIATHKDYDGAPEHSFGPPKDQRCFWGPTLEDVIEQVEEYSEENENGES